MRSTKVWRRSHGLSGEDQARQRPADRGVDDRRTVGAGDSTPRKGREQPKEDRQGGHGGKAAGAWQVPCTKTARGVMPPAAVDLVL